MKKITSILLLSLLVATSITPTFAQSATLAQSEGADLAKLAFISTDTNGDGKLSMTEMRQQGALIFLSMDANDDENLAFEEFLSWGYGLQNIAEDTDRVGRYETALKIVFELWDRDKDGTVSAREHREGVVADVIRADMDNDGRLSQPEFFGAFTLNIALRAALKPE